MAEGLRHCTICHRPLKHRVYMPVLENMRSCRHQYHFECLQSWMRAYELREYDEETNRFHVMEEEPRCPICMLTVVMLYPLKKGAVYSVHVLWDPYDNPDFDEVVFVREGMSEGGYDGDLDRHGRLRDIRLIRQDRGRGQAAPQAEHPGQARAHEVAHQRSAQAEEPVLAHRHVQNARLPGGNEILEEILRLFASIIMAYLIFWTLRGEVKGRYFSS